MSKQLSIITAQPCDSYFIWQLDIQLHNLRKYGLSKSYTALVFWHNNRDGGQHFTEQWDALEAKYPEATFVYYEDNEGKLAHLISKYNYIPLLRPFLLGKHFKEFPGLEKDAILYIDSDVIFTKDPTEVLNQLKDDDICYLTNTADYISAEYFDSKDKDVLAEKVEEYKHVDVLSQGLEYFGLTREIAVANQKGSGGAQYLLKNIDYKFWQSVFIGCISLRIHLTGINRQFFENEDKGFQVWCADMWSVLWNLWAKDYKTECPSSMDHCWATDKIEKWDTCTFYHDAGASTREIEPGHMLFHKRDLPYINNQKTPFEDDLSFVSKAYCSSKYVDEIIEIQREKQHIDINNNFLID